MEVQQDKQKGMIGIPENKNIKMQEKNCKDHHSLHHNQNWSKKRAKNQNVPIPWPSSQTEMWAGVFDVELHQLPR